jgi:DNA (cytosine-5)-methyltransferase 1
LVEVLGHEFQAQVDLTLAIDLGHTIVYRTKQKGVLMSQSDDRDTGSGGLLAPEEKLQPERQLRFADFFSGLGGFHVALSRLGHECVFASEIDEELRAVYQRNFGLTPAGDIRSITARDVPAHDVLCAGFPCQPFSLAGKKKGAACPTSGRLIEDVFRIVKHHRPDHVFLENVPNVLTIENGIFWSFIQREFSRLQYRVEHRIYSSLEFGFPQQRLRLFIVATKSSRPGFLWPEPSSGTVRPLSRYVTSGVEFHRRIEPAKQRVLQKWDELVRHIPSLLRSDTLLASEFGATYPVAGLRQGRPWRRYRGAFGSPLDGASSLHDALQLLPNYAAACGGVPQWMRPYVEYSRWVYQQAPAFFDHWKTDMAAMPNSWQKLEWRGDRSQPSVWAQTIQFRASGIRVMRPDFAPSLVAMSPTQTPILGPKRRYLSVREAASLQSLESLRSFPENNERAFRALGNAVNSEIVFQIAKAALVQQ